MLAYLIEPHSSTAELMALRGSSTRPNRTTYEENS